MFCKKGDIKKFFTPLFYEYLQIWRFFNTGMGLPNGGSWAQEPYNIVLVIMEFETILKNWKVKK